MLVDSKVGSSLSKSVQISIFVFAPSKSDISFTIREVLPDFQSHMECRNETSEKHAGVRQEVESVELALQFSSVFSFSFDRFRVIVAVVLLIVGLNLWVLEEDSILC